MKRALRGCFRRLRCLVVRWLDRLRFRIGSRIAFEPCRRHSPPQPDRGVIVIEIAFPSWQILEPQLNRSRNLEGLHFCMGDMVRIPIWVARLEGVAFGGPDAKNDFTGREYAQIKGSSDLPIGSEKP